MNKIISLHENLSGNTDQGACTTWLHFIVTNTHSHAHAYTHRYIVHTTYIHAML